MYEKYGYFESAKEINERARELLTEGNRAGVIELAKENGIEAEIVEVFCAGEVDYICDDESAAIGKLEIEAKELKAKEIIADWIEYIKVTCYKDEKMAKAVRKKNKSVKECISKLLTWSFKNMYAVDKGILKKAKVSGTVKMGIPGMGTAKKLIKEYFLGE